MKVAVYGSLRPGNYNYDRIQSIFPGKFELVQTGEVAGYKMFDLGHYPVIIPTENTSDVIIVDIIECSEEPMKYIDYMEHGAGYKDTIITVGSYECKIYYMNAVDLVPYNQVKSGDWNKYIDNVTKN